MSMSMSMSMCSPAALGLRAKAVVQIPKSSMVRAAEAVCVVSSAALSIGFAARGGGRLLAAAMVATAAAVGMGAWGRHEEAWLVERVESVEAEVRETAAVVRAMGRQLEKLSIRFRLTRRALKDPIAETAEKNSALEKEVRELQRVLLAMQEQQQKQLDLILALAKTANLLRHNALHL